MDHYFSHNSRIEYSKDKKKKKRIYLILQGIMNKKRPRGLAELLRALTLHPKICLSGQFLQCNKVEN